MFAKFIIASLVLVAVYGAKDSEVPNESMTEWVQRLENKVNKLTQTVDKLVKSGYTEYTLQDVQWQSLHMSAAASCRALTAKGGSGPNENVVISLGGSKTCRQSCNATKYKNCDGALWINGFMGRATSNQIVGMYYNYGCDNNSWGVEESLDDITKFQAYVGYCCCRL